MIGHLGTNSLLQAASGSFLDLVNQGADQLKTTGGINVSKLMGSAARSALVEGTQAYAQSPAVVVNRARAAAALDYGYEKLDQYERWRPTLFAASAAGCAISIAAATKRRKVPEAVTLYSLLALISGGVAWFTRPDALRPAPAPSPVPQAPGEGPGAVDQVLGWVDRRVEHLNQTEPGWETATWQRLSNDLGFGKITSPVRELLLPQGA